MRRLARHRAQMIGRRVDRGVGERGGRVDRSEHALVDELRRDRVAARAQPRHVRGGRRVASRALRHREQRRDLDRRQVLRPVPEVRPRRTLDAFDVLAVRRARQVLLEDLALGQPQIELDRAKHVDELVRDRARTRLEQASQLHRDRRAARDSARMDHVGPRRAHDRDRIDAVVVPEPLVLERDQRGRERRIDPFELDAKPPLIVARQEHVGRLAVAILDHRRPSGIALGERHRVGRADQQDHREVRRCEHAHRPRRRAPREPAPPARYNNLPVHGPPITAVPPFSRAHSVASYIASSSIGGIANLPEVTTRTV